MHLGPVSGEIEGAFMATTALTRICAFVLVVSSWLPARQQPTTPTPSPQASAPTQQQTPSNPPSPNSAQPPTTQPPAESTQQPTAAPKALLPPKEEAWQMLDNACAGDKTVDHSIAIRVMGLMPGDAKALTLAQQGLDNDKPEIRAAAAAALGEMKSR